MNIETRSTIPPKITPMQLTFIHPFPPLRMLVTVSRIKCIVFETVCDNFLFLFLLPSKYCCPLLLDL
jgi:hypothetical protein